MTQSVMLSEAKYLKPRFFPFALLRVRMTSLVKICVSLWLNYVFPLCKLLNIFLIFGFYFFVLFLHFVSKFLFISFKFLLQGLITGSQNLNSKYGCILRPPLS